MKEIVTTTVQQMCWFFFKSYVMKHLLQYNNNTNPLNGVLRSKIRGNYWKKEKEIGKNNKEHHSNGCFQREVAVKRKKCYSDV